MGAEKFKKIEIKTCKEQPQGETHQLQCSRPPVKERVGNWSGRTASTIKRKLTNFKLISSLLISKGNSLQDAEHHHQRRAPWRSVAVSVSRRQRSLFWALLHAAFGPRFREQVWCDHAQPGLARASHGPLPVSRRTRDHSLQGSCVVLLELSQSAIWPNSWSLLRCRAANGRISNAIEDVTRWSTRMPCAANQKVIRSEIGETEIQKDLR